MMHDSTWAAGRCSGGIKHPGSARCPRPHGMMGTARLGCLSLRRCSIALLSLGLFPSCARPKRLSSNSFVEPDLLCCSYSPTCKHLSTLVPPPGSLSSARKRRARLVHHRLGSQALCGSWMQPCICHGYVQAPARTSVLPVSHPDCSWRLCDRVA
jgi:hypothetical protein